MCLPLDYIAMCFGMCFNLLLLLLGLSFCLYQSFFFFKSLFEYPTVLYCDWNDREDLWTSLRNLNGFAGACWVAARTRLLPHHLPILTGDPGKRWSVGGASPNLITPSLLSAHPTYWYKWFPISPLSSSEPAYGVLSSFLMFLKFQHCNTILLAWTLSPLLSFHFCNSKFYSSANILFSL